MDWQSFVTPATPPFFSGATVLVFMVVVLWSLVWKGMALWKAAQKGSKPWFVVLLLVNTVGILEILYLYVLSKKSQAPEVPKM